LKPRIFLWERREPVALHRVDPTAMTPDPGAQDQPGRKEADEEGDEEEDGELDVRLNVAPQA